MMPFGHRGLVATCATISTALGIAHAAVPHVGPQLKADTLTALPAANVKQPLRATAQLVYAQAPTMAWSRFAATHGTWRAAWDAATGVPRRMWGAGTLVPGAMTDPAIAERAAHQALVDNLALLAPGASADDFKLVSNVSDGDIRSIGYVQYAGGHRVVGGQVSFRFKADRLFVIGSEALPNVSTSLATPRAHLARAVLGARATPRIKTAVGLPNAPVVDTGAADVILPLVGDDAVLGYRLVATYTIDGGADGRYAAYVDPGSGEVVAAQQLNEYATGTMIYTGVDRYPGRGRIPMAAPRVHVVADSVPSTTSDAGLVSWASSSPIDVEATADGDLVTVVNKATNGSAVSGVFALDPNGQAIWDASAIIEDDAQLISYLDINVVKSYVRSYVDPTMQTLEDQITVNVNLEQDCNAFFDGKALNFFHKTDKCENTGRIADVGYHEYGHRVHTAEIIEGVGNFDGAMSEGAADFLAVSVTGDSGMGRGFLISDPTMIDEPLRQLDPVGMEWTWPNDIQEMHHTGLIFGGTFWDLREAFIAQLGPDAGIAMVNKLYVGALRRAVDIPTSLIEALATDDDDGDLSNGTPHECTIRDTFGRHGLRTASGHVDAPGHLDEDALSIGIVFQIDGLSNHCAGDQLAGGRLQWKPPYTGIPEAGNSEALLAGQNRFFAQLPLSPHESVSFKVAAKFADGSEFTLPDNLADPFYQLYTGHTKVLYCTDFEDGDPFQNGWTTGTDDGMDSLWTWGVPAGGGATDPPAAYSGTHILNLAMDTEYRPKEATWVEMPEIDVGQYTDVRVQYRRWLAVEDSHYDHASVSANKVSAWLNATANIGDSSALHHIDREWRFHDVPVSSYFLGHKLHVRWELTSDEGYQLGGWALDDVCVVANPLSICGDGVKTVTESCDEGSANADVPNKCRTYCKLPACGDGIVDDYEECDAGQDGSPTCSNKCKVIDIGGGGCCSVAGGDAAGSLLLGLVVIARLRRRRR